MSHCVDGQDTDFFSLQSTCACDNLKMEKMVKNKIRLNKFYQKLIEKEDISYKEALFIYEALHKEAVSLGKISSKNILEGLEIDIRVAKALNGLTQ